MTAIRRAVPAIIAAVALAGATAAETVTESVPVHSVPPAYPLEALLKGVAGQVRVEFTIEVDGTVTDVRVIESRPEGVFDEAVLDIFPQWRFAPRTVNGQPVRSRAAYTVAFDLDG